MVKHGYKGPVYTTGATTELCGIMLRDSAHIQEFEAEWRNRKAKRSGGEEYQPLYTMQDAEAALALFREVDYGDTVEVGPNIRARFTDVGHLLGSASIEVWVTEGAETRKVVFSGDIGNTRQPLLRDPQPIHEADYVVMESTYGDRNHEPPESYTEALAQLIDETFAQGGNVIIPSFAVGRTQELLYFLREIKDEGLVKSAPNFQVCVDSPLAAEATRIYSGDLRGYLDEEAIEVLQGGDDLFTFPGLTLVQSTEESKALNMDRSSKIIISASGMCDAGRIRHHLKYNLWRRESTIVFVGFQSPGTLGRTLLDGAKSVKLFGAEVAVLAEIENFKGLSSHADRDHLIQWAQSFENPAHFFVVHGDREVAPYFADSLQRLGLSAHAPQYTEVYDLVAGRQLFTGYLPERKVSDFAGGRVSNAYQRLVAMGKLLQEVIVRSKGRANRDLGNFADQIKQLIDKWEA